MLLPVAEATAFDNPISDIVKDVTAWKCCSMVNITPVLSPLTVNIPLLVNGKKLVVKL